jgi:outer membrane protein W
MAWARMLCVVACLGLGAGMCWGEPPRAGEPSAAPAKHFDDSERLYFWFESGMNFTLQRHFAGDIRVVPQSAVELNLGGGVGYNINEHWGVEFQANGVDPWLRSESLGAVKRIAVMNFVPAVRYRWHLYDGQLVPYLTGGVGVSTNDVHGNFSPFASASSTQTTVVGSLSAGFDYFISENVAAGLDFRSVIHPSQDAVATYINPRTGRIREIDDSTNLTALSLLAHIRVFPGQPLGAEGGRKFFLADHGPFDTDEMRGYVTGLFGYDFIWDKNAGSGVHLRDKGGDANLTKGGAVGMNFDGNWGAEVQLLWTMLNIRQATGPRFAKLDVFEVLPVLRYRYPLLDGRLVPFLIGGIGTAFLDTSEDRPNFESRDGRQVIVYPHFDPGGPAIVGVLGVGIEYFLNHHLSVGLIVPVHIYSTVDTSLKRTGHQTQTGTADLTGVEPMLQLKAYIP